MGIIERPCQEETEREREGGWEGEREGGGGNEDDEHLKPFLACTQAKLEVPPLLGPRRH